VNSQTIKNLREAFVTVANRPDEAISIEDKSPGQDQIAVVGTLVDSKFADSRSPHSWLAVLPSLLPLIFLILGASTVIFLAVCTPPFQSPDEDNHFKRSYQVSNGGLFHPDGGDVDQGIDEAFLSYSQLPHNPEAKVTAADEGAASTVKWTGRRVFNYFTASAYAPTGYIPQALGIALGRLFDLSVINTLRLSRLLNGAFALSISTLALCWCRRGKLVMFAILMMPTAMSLLGSCNQDASTISVACLAFAILSRQIEEGSPFLLRMSFILAFTLLFISLTRPPYAGFLFLFLIPGLLPRWNKLPAWLSKLSFVGLPIVLTSAWWLAAVLSQRATYRLPGTSGIVDPKLQLLNLFRHPGTVREVLGDGHLYITRAASIIANLGWQDTKLPSFYYWLMALVLLTAMIGEMAYKGKFRISALFLTVLATLCAASGIFLTAYLLWDPVGSGIVLGVQGRYLIPLVVAIGFVLPPLTRSDRIYHWATVVVVCGQVATLIQLPWAIIQRYYLR
jgi:uncharacterized membrane protein